MALPEGVTTATVIAGVPVTHTGQLVKSFVSIEPSVYLVHAATGTPLVDFLEELDISEGTAGQFILPHTDQAGFIDESGNAYTNWYYTARVTYSTSSKAKTKAPKVKVFQLTTGQVTVDLDLLPSGAPALPYIAPAANVSAFHGRTGPVTLQESDLPARLTEAALTAAVDAQMDGAGIKGADDGTNATAFYKNAADKVSYTIGNAPGSAGFAGTGTPAKALGALAIYQRFGDHVGGSNAPIINTTQAAYLLANYYGPTTDDSAEAFSTFVGIKNTGASFTQSKPVTGFESIAQVEGANIVDSSGYALGVGSRINVLGTAHVEFAYGFKAAVNSSGGPVFGTIGTYKAFCQPISSGAANSWGVYVADAIQSEKSLLLAKSGDTGLFRADFAGSGGGNPAFVYVQNPQATNMATMRLQAITGQTAALAEFWAVGSSFVNASVTRLGSFISTAGFFAQNSGGTTFWSFDNNGPKWGQASLTQTTVGAAGGAAALPATPKRYLKVTDYDGTLLVVPAFLAS